MMAHEFGLVRRILKEHCGLNLGEDKQDLIEGKLRPLLREFGLPTLSHLVLAMMKPDAHGLRARVAQAVSIQESYFFRDKAPFRYFVDVMLPTLMANREASHRIRIWCAAAAAGQEPYSLAMELAECNGRLTGWTIEIIATDFVEGALDKARKGLYSQFEVQRGLPVSLLVKHFKRVEHGWEISSDIRRRVDFRNHNLLDDSQALGMFDVICCRNVLIYFDDATKRAVLTRLAKQLAPDGYLVLGAAEMVSGCSQEFKPVAEGLHGIFRFTPQTDVAAGLRDTECTNEGIGPARASARR